MTRIKPTDTVGAVVARHPALARVFEQAGIDYCCGGKNSVAHACAEKGLDPLNFLGRLEDVALQPENESAVDPATMSLAALADHIERTHHAYLRSEFARLAELTGKVAAVHGTRDPRVIEIRNIVRALAAELSSHMMKEEQILFPLVRQLEAGDGAPPFPGCALSYPMGQMELEHERAGTALERLRELTDGYVAPPWACNTHRALLDALAHLERDMHQHVHKENNVLFPRALDLERRHGAAAD